MAHHAYYIAGDREEGIQAALSFAERELDLHAPGNANVQVLRYGLFSIEEARKVVEAAALAPSQGAAQVFILAAERFFHETQNALLKVFEEPSPGTHFVLVIPSEGVLIPTFRSRLVALPHTKGDTEVPRTRAALTKEVERILARAKKDAAEEKQAARAEALVLVQHLTQAAYAAEREKGTPELQAFLSDLEAFTRILHERSAPLKPILEHLLITAPAKL